MSKISDNFLGFTDEAKESIYRIMPIERLCQSFSEKKLHLIPPDKWDDPFENQLLSSLVKTKNGEIADMSSIRDGVYGQCWTRHKETDALWRIYFHDKLGVRVKCDPTKLLKSLWKTDTNYDSLNCFLGKVVYHQTENLEREYQRLDLFNSDAKGIAQSLLLKRKEFEHENEVRLIYTIGKGETHAFKIDPNSLFEEIIFDPRIDDSLYEIFKNMIIERGYEKNKIDKSDLYKLPHKFIFRTESL